jgi:DNA-binding MarR family transcriptional regulator
MTISAKTVTSFKQSLEQIWDWQDRTLERILARHNLHPQHYLILKYVVHREEVDRSELAMRSTRSQGALTRAIQALDRKDLVTLRQQTGDKRKVTILPTEAATELCSSVEQSWLESVQAIVEEIPAGKRADVLHALLVLKIHVPLGRFDGLVPHG